MRLIDEINKKPANLEELQLKITLIFIALTFFSMFFFGVVDLLMGVNLEFLKIRLVYIVLLIGTSILFFRYKKHFLAINLMMFLVLSFLVINFLYSDGYQGPTIFNFYLFFMVSGLLFKRPYDLIWHISSIGIYFVFFYLETTGRITVVKNYENLTQQFIDNSLTILITSILVFIGVRFVILNYQKQNADLIKLQKENDHNLEELKLVNEKKNQLIALLSHDLKSPVSSLAMTLELMDLEMISKEDFEQIINRLKKQSVHLSHVLENTLSWVMTEMGNHEIEPHAVDVVQLTLEMAELMDLQAARKDQIIETFVPEERMILDLEEKEIRIILRNYLDNSIKFSPVGSTITLEFVSSPQYIRWNVKNLGERISKEKEKQLFEFSVKSSAGTLKEKGTGLGLGLCKRIANRIGFQLGYEWSQNGYNVFFLEKRIS
jgi:two-component system, sensor histidine kinase and response regulator